MLKNRQAVGGLISLIGLVVVFAISSVAYLEINSTQSNFISNSIQINQLISDRNQESLNFTDIKNNNTHYNVTITNIGSEPIIIDSYLVRNDTSLSGKGIIGIKIQSGDESLTSISANTPDASTDKIVFVTELGKKCVMPGDAGFREC